MYRPLPLNAHYVAGLKVSPWVAVPGSEYCSMRFLEGTDLNVVDNRVAFIEKTPRVRFLPASLLSEDWLNWHQGWKGDDGWDEVAQGWCDTHLLAMGYDVPDAKPFRDSML